MVITPFKTADFLATLADHVPDRYRHNIRYFGLLVPRTKARTYDIVFALLGQKRLGKPRRPKLGGLTQEIFRRRPIGGPQGRTDALGRTTGAEYTSGGRAHGAE